MKKEIVEGLQVEITSQGQGEKVVEKGNKIKIHYTGKLENGVKFDSSVDRGQPFETQIGVGMLIRGWDIGILGMKEGEKRTLTINSDLAYGDNGISGVIPPKATLIFDVELLEIL